MAQLAAQDYFARLQASGLSPFQHPELAAAFPGMGMGGNVGSSSSATGRQGTGDGKNNSKSRKEKKSNSSNNSMGGGSGASTTITSSAGTSSAYKVFIKQIYIFIEIICTTEMLLSCNHSSPISFKIIILCLSLRGLFNSCCIILIQHAGTRNYFHYCRVLLQIYNTFVYMYHYHCRTF